MSRVSFIVAVACAVVLGATAPLVAEDRPVELVVIVHADNPANPSASELGAMFRRDQTRWSSGDVIIPLNSPPDSAERKQYDGVVLGLAPDDTARYWLDQRIRHGTQAPREIGDAAQLVRLVAHLKGAIAYVPSGTKLAGVRVVARVQDKVVTR